MSGGIIGETGQVGKAAGEFGEAHYLAVSAQGEIYVADTLNWRVQNYVKK